MYMWYIFGILILTYLSLTVTSTSAPYQNSQITFVVKDKCNNGLSRISLNFSPLREMSGQFYEGANVWDSWLATVNLGSKAKEHNRHQRDMVREVQFNFSQYRTLLTHTFNQHASRQGQFFCSFTTQSKNISLNIMKHATTVGRSVSAQQPLKCYPNLLWWHVATN